MTEGRNRVRFSRASALAGSWLMLAALMWLAPSKGLCQDSVKTTQTDYWEKRVYVTGQITYGVGVLGGDPARVFSRQRVLGFGLGLRYHRITLSCQLQFGIIDDLKNSYEESTQWESLDLEGGNFPIDLGYQFAASRRFFMEPFVGLYWSVVGNQWWDEPYINWDRRGLSRFWPTAGARFKFLMSGFQVTGGGSHYFVGEIRLSMLRFTNADYGNGYALHLTIGYGGDGAL